jgi:ABC-type branched-subunit amino acid transport system substrate-binding protein
MRRRPHLHSDHQPRRVGRAALLALAIALCAAGCGGAEGSKAAPETLTIAVNAPFSGSPYIAQAIAHGVELGVQTRSKNGVMTIGEHSYRIRVQRLDNELSPGRALQNVRRAIDEHALAVIDEGTGVDASWKPAEDARLPIGIVYQGGSELVDPVARPNVFRIAPTDSGLAYRLGEYLIPKGLHVALMTDDTGYGRQGAAALAKAFALDPKNVAARIDLPAGQSDLSPQVLRAKRAGADALLVWARGPAVAAVLSAARARGWNVPVYTTQPGADPVVRQQLADHPEWVDGLTFASGRMTAEEGPAPFAQFESSYASAFGPDDVGVKTSAGERVHQPPEVPMYAFDMTQAILAALEANGGPDDREGLLRTLGSTTVEGANGDARSFNRRNHEGVIDDDVAFAVFHDMTFAPVEDDPLSATLPPVSQTGQ